MYPNLFRLFAVLSLGVLVSGKFTTDYNLIAKLKIKAEQQKETIAQQYMEMKQQQTELMIRNEEVEALFKEVHHRVKNNLQMVSNLLDVTELIDQGKKPEDVLKDSQSRIATMTLLHQQLYTNERLASISLQNYIHDLILKIAELKFYDGKINYMVDCGGHHLTAEKIIPLGLIVTELITNAMKYSGTKEEGVMILVKCKQIAYKELC